QMCLVILLSTDIESILENVEGNVVAVIGVKIIFVGSRWLSGFEDNFEIAIPSAFDLALTGPPVQRLLVMRPRGAPVHLISSHPKKIGKGLVRLGPHEIASVFVVVGADQFLELLLRLLKF